ncbi:type II toxin-antitoxin system RelE/ParE family toxin [Enterobacter ludwigii]|uniref:type II toxin-antitoxin system RelE family toxin n=1 Tax=Enterobacter ludwigii TaxID=299767 RepID=UPI0030767B16
MTQISWTGRAVKDLRKLPVDDQKAIREKVNVMESYPDLGSLDIKKLTDQDGQYRLRVKSYRVIYSFVNGEPLIIEIERVLRRGSTTY